MLGSSSFHRPLDLSSLVHRALRMTSLVVSSCLGMFDRSHKVLEISRSGLALIHLVK